jgi:arylsulfatase A-like enzyme
MGNPLRPEARTMAEALRESGLTTSAILSFRYFDPGTGFDQGFDHYDNEAAREGTLEGITAPTLLRKVQAEIARLGDRRFFLFLHVLDPHHEYLIHPGYPSFGRGRRDRYDAEIAFSDDYVGRMLAAIEGGPQGGRTLVVLAADHGEAFGEHGVVYHNTTVYQEMLRIPLVARLPGARPRRLEAPVSLVDLLPTFLNVVGRRATGMVGHSFLGAVATGREDFSRIVYAETTDTQQPRRRLRRATSDSYALVHDATAGTFQLFDRRRDPGEERPLAGGGGAEGERLRMALEAFEAQERRARP